MTKPFTTRTRDFWAWFTANEAKLSAFVENKLNPQDADTQQIVNFIAEGVALLADGVHFNMGGDYEFTFTVSGNDALFYLLPYVTANLPQQFRGKWKFFSCMPGAGGENYEFRMLEHDKNVDTDNVFISAQPDEEGKTADLQFDVPQWADMDDDNCYNAFFILMDIAIGEALAYTSLRNVERATAQTPEMIPLTQLAAWMRTNLCENGAPPDPADRHTAYKQTPEENARPPRNDIFVGAINYTRLISQYFQRDNFTYDTFTNFGAKPIFLYYYYSDKDDQKEVLNRRYDLQDQLEAEVLGKRNSGEELGLMLGGAMGQWCAYIDLLLYDEAVFLEKAKALLADVPVMFFCHEFAHDGRKFSLFGKDDPLYDARVQQLRDCGAQFEIDELN